MHHGLSRCLESMCRLGLIVFAVLTAAFSFPRIGIASIATTGFQATTLVRIFMVMTTIRLAFFR